MDKHLKTLSAINAFHGVKNRVSVQQAVHHSETSSIAEIQTQGTYTHKYSNFNLQATN